ncbi:DUF3800 domain-containing protein [Viridibacillus arvi]|uniref:DUF3800 domain-containing protein n=1 Tax=Viridibacillus arvi TaxID=263475 RepID=UPI003698B15A
MTLYYDETNNIRKLHIESNGLNIDEPQIFVLGGIIIEDESKLSLSIEELKKSINLQKSAKEIKRKHVAKGNIIDILNSPKTTSFFNWLDTNHILIHYINVDLLYYSVVDIIDSLILNSSTIYIPLNLDLKNLLYELILINKAEILEIFHKYEYPNISPDNTTPFIINLKNCLFQENESFIELKKNYDANYFHFIFHTLNGLFKDTDVHAPLAFLTNEKSFLLVDSFEHFYVTRLSLYQNAIHILDEEKSLNKELIKSCVGNTEFKFVPSHTCDFVQISDVVVGILGKFFSYINKMNLPYNINFQSELNSVGTNNLKLLCKLLLLSEERDIKFLCNVLSSKSLENFRSIINNTKVLL